MNFIEIISRDDAEFCYEDNGVPDNEVIISFYDKGTEPIKLGCNNKNVLLVEIDDIDVDDPEYYYEDFFPQAFDVGRFIMKSRLEGKVINCQCEDGETKSAGCAAAIAEYFYGRGAWFFLKEDYKPNKAVFYKTYQALCDARVEMTDDEINSLLSLKKIFDRTALVSRLSSLLYAIYKKGPNINDHTEWYELDDTGKSIGHYDIITNDGVEYCFDHLSRATWEIFDEIFSKYSKDDIVYICLSMDQLSFAYRSNDYYFLDSENGRINDYCTNRSKKFYEQYINSIRKKYNVRKKEIFDCGPVIA